jgi:uncharacterized protein (TIRG00374 family)
MKEHDRMSTLIRRAVRALLWGVAILGAFVCYTGAGTIARGLHRFAWSAFVVACGLAAANFLLRFVKWEYYLRLLEIRGVPRGDSLLIFLSGFVLTITPGKVGEIFKSLILFQLRGVPVARSAPIVVAERITDLIGVIVLIMIGSVSFAGGLFWASLGALLVGALLVSVASPRLSHRLLSLLPRLPGRLGLWGGRLAPRLGEALAQVRALTTPVRLVFPVLLSVVAWALEGVGLWVILRGLGHTAPLPFTAFFDATATLAGALVPVPGGLGVTEGLLKEQMVRLGGVGAATATAAMLLARLATLWFAVAVGFGALAILRARHPARLAAEPTPAPATPLLPLAEERGLAG